MVSKFKSPHPGPAPRSGGEREQAALSKLRPFISLVKNVSRRFNKSGLHPSQVPVVF